MPFELGDIKSDERRDLCQIIGNSPRYWTASDRVHVLKEAYKAPTYANSLREMIACVNHEGTPSVVADNVLHRMEYNLDLTVVPFLKVIYNSLYETDEPSISLAEELEEIVSRYDITLKN